MTEDQQKEIWLQFHRFQKSRETIYTPKINRALRSQVKQFLDAKSYGYSDTDALQSITSESLLRALKPLYLDAGITYGSKHIAYLRTQKARMPIGFNALMTQLMEQYFQIDLLNTVENITAYTREKIRDILIAAYALGSSFTEISNELTAIGFTYQRARLIARTETVTAANTGAHIAAGTTGLELRKVWISAQDNRTRRRPRDKFDHLEMNGVTVGYNDLFQVSGERLVCPGDRKHNASAGNVCNCRCTQAYSPVRNSNGRLKSYSFTSSSVPAKA
jgi:hypothetical protein